MYLHISRLFAYFVGTIVYVMNRNDKMGLSKQQLSDIEHKLQYVEFTSERELSCDDDNSLSSLCAIACLSGWNYTADGLLALLLDNEDAVPEAAVLRRYRDVLGEVLSSPSPMGVDESAIMQLYNRVWGEPRPAVAPVKRGRVADILAQRPASQPSHAVVVSPQLGSMVEGLLQYNSHDRVQRFIAIARFLYRVVSHDTFEKGREEMMHLLSLILLRHMGVSWVVTYSPCRAMLNDRVAYRKALYGSVEVGGGESQWIVYWVTMLYEAARQVTELCSMRRHNISLSHKDALNTRQRRIVDFIDKNQPVKLADIVSHLHKESVNTVKKDLLMLREQGYIASQGVLKGTRYYKI